MVVVELRFAHELQVDVPQRGVEAERIGLGLIEQHPLEAPLPQRQRLRHQRGLAHAAQADNHRHRLNIHPGSGTDEVRTQPGQFPCAPDEMLMARRG